MTESSKGAAAAIAAFTLWGLLPAFWKQLDFLPASSIVAHRTIWAFALLLPLLLIRGRLGELLRHLRQPRQAAWLLLSGALLGANWIVYVWATLNDRVLEGALGYYINPFFNILLGWLFLGERYRPAQLAAVLLAAVGVALQFPAIDGVPWVALILGSSFACYGLARKTSELASLPALAGESALLLPVAVAWLLLTSPQPADLYGGDPARIPLLLASGLATISPLMLFSAAARRIRLGTLGILQFLGPTLQFLLGWLVYDEPLSSLRLLSFACVWLAVALYAAASIAQRPRKTGDPGGPPVS